MLLLFDRLFFTETQQCGHLFPNVQFTCLLGEGGGVGLLGPLGAQAVAAGGARLEGRLHPAPALHSATVPTN